MGDHTWTHAALTGLSRGEQTSEIDRTRRAAQRAAGEPVVFFRPPEGVHDDEVDRLVRSLGLVEIIWTVDSMDSRGASPPEVLANVLNGLRPGAIILMHENRGSTLSELPAILRGVKARGYTPVTLSRLLQLDPPSTRELRRGPLGCR